MSMADLQRIAKPLTQLTQAPRTAETPRTPSFPVHGKRSTGCVRPHTNDLRPTCPRHSPAVSIPGCTQRRSWSDADSSQTPIDCARNAGAHGQPDDMPGPDAVTELATREEVASAASPPVPSDPTRFAVSLVSLVLLVLGVVGWLSGVDAARGVGFFLFALLGFGSAWLVILRRPDWPALSFSAPLGLTTCVLAGWVMVETHTWHAGVPLFVIATVAAGAIHAATVVRHLRTRSTPDDFRNERPESTTTFTESRAPGNEAVIGLSLAGLAACLWSAAFIGPYDPTGPAALFGAISPLWYVGLVCIIVGVVLGLRRPGSSGAIPVVALQLVLTMTLALAYGEPHSSWAGKHVGVTLYIMVHGRTNPTIDIYQAFPGLFAGVAWLCHAVGASDPMVVARWWPPVIDLATLLVFQRLAYRALGDVRRSWIAAALFVVGNTIGQDYYSPQATGFLLAITIFAFIYKQKGETRSFFRSEWIVLALIAIAVAVTHQLTPYIVTGVAVVLAVFGLIRARLTAVITLLPAVAWALINRSVVRRYFSFKQIGSVATNILPKGLANQTLHKSELIHLNSYAMAGDIFIIGTIGVLVLLRERTAVHLAWAVCALSGLGLFLANSYGNEGAFRVALFALPWLSILCADWKATRHTFVDLAPVLVLPLLLGLYLFANYGLDYIRVVRPGDVQAIRKFEHSAPKGSKLFVLGYSFAPIKSSARYPLLNYHYYPYVAPPNNRGRNFSAQRSYVAFMQSRIPALNGILRKHRFYVLAAQEPAAAMVEVHLATIHEYDGLSEQFANSPSWRTVTHTSTATLYVLRTLVLLTARPVVSGTAAVGQKVTATHGHWASVNPVRYSYQWEACSGSAGPCTPIVGAVHQSYAVKPADIGRALRVVVTARDTDGTTATAIGARTAVVPVAPRGVQPTRR